ncbi:hypothetical protein AU210_010071 [Fusarium oxysporum f. sp. radicis-cucumerinum]|uniref:Tautomerase cis-CaaD-like domain-containing protein n=1 Tax=Fusarium oxysporum f. sp. radicis-cucumerinum TaxID=327505 RepID=A0A2H3GZ06_FUSOX|nr:hypothetical protein AU210_010071 [Fusarium oxysporum f. sp. radicis-cucumerinum]
MPLWNIYHTEGAFDSQETRNKLAQDITKIYSNGENGLPAFYVVVQFIPLPPGHVFVGGEARDEKPFVRLVVQHMAVHSHEGVHMEDFPKQFSDYINATIKPYIADKGYDWEITVTDTQRDFWRFNGIAPPPWRSEAERAWARNGRPSEWEEK